MKINLTLLTFLYAVFASAQTHEFVEIELSIPSEKVTVNGALLAPEISKKVPLVIIIPGSGLCDRDGNQAGGKGNSLKYLAEGLALNDIASYRYDKSTVVLAQKVGLKEEEISVDDFITDAVTVIRYFKNQERFSKIIVTGHSQGSLVGMVASESGADAFISLAGAGRSIDEILTEQVVAQSPMFKDDLAKTFGILNTGKIDENFNPLLVSIFRKSLQPFWMSWMKYKPQEEIKKLNIPILIINGTKDIQVPVSDAALLHKANTKSELQLIENMNHVFKEVTVDDRTENIATYTNTDLPTMIELIDVITKFVNRI
tara:strand:- start:104138 stop:105082 length:945 start_codon:yes stop_codon:yes gene_type:complete